MVAKDTNGNIAESSATLTPLPLGNSFSQWFEGILGLNTGGQWYAAPAFVDIDGDGDFDLFVGYGTGHIAMAENLNTEDGAVRPWT